MIGVGVAMMFAFANPLLAALAGRLSCTRGPMAPRAACMQRRGIAAAAPIDSQGTT